MAYTEANLVRDFNRFSIMKITNLGYGGWTPGRRYMFDGDSDECHKFTDE